MIEQLTQNQIEDLPDIDTDRYENIFNVYKIDKDDETSYYYFNILKKITIDTDNIDPGVFKYVKITKPIPWTTLSYDNYRTQHLWWLILATNKIINPLELPQTGNIYKIIRREYVSTILSQIQP